MNILCLCVPGCRANIRPKHCKHVIGKYLIFLELLDEDQVFSDHVLAMFGKYLIFLELLDEVRLSKLGVDEEDRPNQSRVVAGLLGKMNALVDSGWEGGLKGVQGDVGITTD